MSGEQKRLRHGTKEWQANVSPVETDVHGNRNHFVHVLTCVVEYIPIYCRHRL